MASRSKTTTETGGTAAGEAAGQWGLNQYQGMMDPTAYGGNVAGAQGANTAQNQQYNMLTGMQSGYGAPGGYQGMYQNLSGANAQQLGPMDRRGGPGAGYMNPYQDQMIGGLERDLKRANAMGANQVGSGAGSANAFGGARHGVAEGVMSGENARNFMDGATRIRSDSYDKGMQYMGQDQNRNIAITQANNQANLGFGNMNMNAASGDINNRRNIAGDLGNYGLNQQNQQNMADMFNYGEFNRMQRWKPDMMNNYMQGVSGTPWQTTMTTTTNETGQEKGPSAFDKAMGYAGTAAGAYLAYKGYTAGGGGTCIPKGTTIDMADGSKVPIEKIEAGDLVIGMDGEEVEVQQVHQYKQIPHAKFVTITFDNGSKVNCSHDHMINNKRARNYILYDKIGSREVTNVVFYMGVERSYDIITTTGGYRIEGIPVNTMIPEMAERSLALANKLMKAA